MKSLRTTKMLKKTSLILILVLAFLIFFSPAKPVHAQFGVFDYASAIEGFLDFGDPFVGLLIKFVLICTLSLVYILVSAALLQWVIELPVNLGSSVVLGGWHFVLGLVNLFFILALLAIAFAYLLRIESFQIKKTLPRLILVILLVNFSLLLVGMVVDVSEFFMNTLRDTYGGNFVELATMNLRSSIVSLLAPMVTILGGYLVSTYSIYAAIPVLVGIIIGYTSGVFVGMFFQSILFIVFNIVLGSIFFLYFILFLGRIVALWLLAIFSPVAFFCLIFPQTQQYAKKWFRALIQWSFMGVVALFLLGLITVAYNTIIQSPGLIDIGGISIIPGFSISDSVYSYLFMMVFLGIAWYATKKYVPVGATEGLNMLKQSRGMMTKRVMDFGKKAAKGKNVQRLSQSMSQIRSTKKYKEEEMAKAEGTAGKAWVHTKSLARAPFTWATKKGGQQLQVTAAEERREDMERRQAKYKGTSIEKQTLGMDSPVKEERIAALNQVAIDGNRDLAIKRGVSPQKLTEITAEAIQYDSSLSKALKKGGFADELDKSVQIIGGVKYGKVKERAEKLRSKGKGPEAENVESTEFKRIKEEMEEFQKERGLKFDDKDKKEYKTLRVKIMSEAKGGDFAKMGEDTLKNMLFEIPEEERRALWAHLSPEQLAATAREHKGKITDLIRAQSLSYVDLIRDNNEKLFSYLNKSAGARNAGIILPEEKGGKVKERAEKILEKSKEEEEKKKEPTVSIPRKFIKRHEERKEVRKEGKPEEKREEKRKERLTKKEEKQFKTREETLRKAAKRRLPPESYEEDSTGSPPSQ